MGNYQLGIKRATEAQKNKLIEAINPAQSSNDSKFKEKLSEYKLSVDRVKKNALFVSGGSSVVHR